MSYHDIQFQSIDSLARILANKIPDNSAILAWSLGGLLAIKIAHSWPKKVSQLIFISSQPKFTNARGWKGIDQRQADLYLELSINNINDFYSRFKKLVNYPNKKSNIIRQLNHHFLYLESEQLTKFLKVIFQVDLRHEYCRIEKPILHIINGKDAILNQSCYPLKALNEQAKIVIIKDSGHIGFLTHAQKYKEIIGRFVDG